ncbi:MAG: ankyrin repeat domain-containing protein [Pirellulales bacterium]
MSVWIRSSALASVALLSVVLLTVAAIATIWQVWHSRRTSPMKSPPLVDRRGVVLDAEMRERLLEVIFEAARHDDVATIDEYLKEGFSPNVRSPRGDTLLTVAAYYDSLGVVERLLAAPAIDIEARNRMGLTAVSGAAFKGNERALRRLIDAGADVNAGNSMQQTALMFASLTGRSRTVQMLLDAGARRDRIDAMGRSPASLAADQGADDVVRLLENR